MSIHRIQPRDFAITRGPRSTLGEATGAVFDAGKLRAGFNPDYRRQHEIYSGLREFLPSVMDRQGTLYDSGEQLPEDLIGMLYDQGGSAFDDGDVQLDDETLSRLYGELDARGVQVPEEISLEAIQRKREEVNQRYADAFEMEADVLARASPAARFFGGLAGGIAAEFTDPANIALSLAGAPARVSFLGLVAIEAAINAAIEVAQTPSRNELLREFEQEEQSVLANALFGAAFGGVFASLIRGAQVGGPAAFRQAAPLFRRREVRSALLDATRDSTDPVIQQAREAVLTDVAEELASVSNPQDRGALTEHAERAQEASAAAAEGRDPQIPDRPSVAQPPRAIIGGMIEEVDPRELAVQADVFQFKSEIVQEGGVTPKLLGVTSWAPERAGIVVVYEYASGVRAIADGHQRTALANRIMQQDPSQQISMAARVYREQDGFSPEDVRVIAALKNISEAADGMTVAMARDAAKVLRVRPDAIAELPAGPGIARARSLSRLSDDAFQLYINQVIPERFAELIGRMVDDPTMHLSMARLIERVRPETTTQAESVLSQALQAPVARETTADLFGEQQIVESLFLERAKVLERAMKILRDDRSVFRTLTERQDRIEGTGQNKLDEASNAEIRKTVEEAIAAMRTLAHRAGPISEALNDGATRYRAGERIGQSAERVAAAVRDEISRNGLAGVGAGARGRDAEPQGSRANAPDPNAGFADPIGPGQQEQIAATRIALSDSTPSRVEQTLESMTADGPRVTVRREEIGPEEFRALDRGLRNGQPGRDLDEYMEMAARNHDDLNAEAGAIAADLGLDFSPAPLKTRESSARKINTKYNGDHRQMVDVARAGVTVRTLDEAEAFVAALGRRFHIVDEGFNQTPAGYFDAKLTVRFDDGQIGEFQMWPPGMLDAKETRGGHGLYEEARLPDTSPERRAELEAQMRDLYGSVIASLDPDAGWSRFGGAGAPTSASIRASSEGGTSTARSSDSTARAVSSEGSDQAPLPQTEARLRTDETAATLDTSNNTSFMGDTSTPDISMVAAGRNSERTAAGEQVLIDGIDPITERQRLEQIQEQGLQARAQPDDTHIGGLFDPMDKVRNDLFDQVPVGRAIDKDGREVAVTQTKAELRRELDAEDEFVDQLGLCLR